MGDDNLSGEPEPLSLGELEGAVLRYEDGDGDEIAVHMGDSSLDESNTHYAILREIEGKSYCRIIAHGFADTASALKEIHGWNDEYNYEVLPYDKHADVKRYYVDGKFVELRVNLPDD